MPTALVGRAADSTSGFPAHKITEAGHLPKGLTFSGAPKAGTNGTYPVTITAKNSSGAVNAELHLHRLVGERLPINAPATGPVNAHPSTRWMAAFPGGRFPGRDAKPLLMGHEGSFADHAENDAVILEDPQGLLGRDVANAMFLAEGLDTRHAAGQRAVLDLTTEQRRQLLIQRRGRVMINYHMITVGNPWHPSTPRGSCRNHMVPAVCSI
jgi:hypothetical protein